MKYLCKSCKKECNDILKHLMTVHKFSKKTVESQLQTNPDSYKNSFVELKNDTSKTTIQEKGRY
jgi:hypothetical protein